MYQILCMLMSFPVHTQTISLNNSKSYAFLQALISNEHSTTIIKETIVQENGKVLTDNDDGIHRAYGIRSEYYNKTTRPLRLRKKLYEFYTAPITKFWANAVGRSVLQITADNTQYNENIFFCYR